MRSLLVEAVPAIALRSLAETLVEHRAVVVEHVVLAGNVKDALGLQALQRFTERVEFLGLRKVRQVARVQNERRRRGKRVDFGVGFAQGSGNVRVCRLAEAGVAGAALAET